MQREVARELASHLRLKLLERGRSMKNFKRGEGTGFSSEIETRATDGIDEVMAGWRGNWLLI